MFKSNRHRLRAAAADDRPGAGGLAGGATQLDAAALDRLRQLDPDGTRGFVKQVLATYAASLQRSLDQLQALREQQATPGVGQLAHMLKSSSSSVGALEFSKRCAAVEGLARDADPQVLDQPLQDLLDEGARVLGAVRAMLQP